MTTLFSSAGRVQRLPRQWATMAGSAVVHAAAIGALVGLAGATAAVVTREPDAPLRFIQVLPPPPLKPPVRLPPLVKEQLTLVETPPVPIEPPPVPEPIVARSEPAPSAPEPIVERAVERLQPKAVPTVSIGAFETAAAARTAAAPRELQSALFDGPPAHAPGTASVAMRVGAFDQGSGPSASGTPRGKVVANAGFGGGTVGGSGRGGSGAVTSGGFDFDAAQAKRAPEQAHQGPAQLPPEILSKPTPAYTDEARAQRIEGEVVLEVELTAAGEVRVLRVMRGLGHGLDESAIRAATAIRFKPAQRSGQPVDFRTTLNIVFRLA